MDDLILEERIDDGYQPTETEIREYAEWLGISVSTEPDLLWIAKEGLVDPLPPDWKPCTTADGNIYYFNFTTGESLWDHPCDAKYQAMVKEERLRRQQGGNDKPSVAAKVKGHDKPTPAKDPAPPDKPSEDTHTAPESVRTRRVVSKTTETLPEAMFKAMSLQEAKRGDKKGRTATERELCSACEHKHIKREATQYSVNCKEMLCQPCKESHVSFKQFRNHKFTTVPSKT